MEEKIKEKTKFYLALSQYIPKNKIFFGIIIFLKFLPLFVITHDWNISYKRGISYWVRKFTLSEVLSCSSAYKLYIIILILLFLLIVCICICFRFYIFIEKRKMILKIYTYVLFYIFYAFNQYIYSIISEVLFNKKKNDINDIFYLVLILISLITIVAIIYSNISICSIFLNSPLFIKNDTLIINPLNEIDYSIAVLSFLQGCIQLELNISFKKCMFIKNVIRALFVLYYIKDILSFNKYYNRYKLEYAKKFFLSSCFFSSIMEWCFYYDYNNKLLVLQKENGIILLKLFLELNFALIATKIHFLVDNSIIIKRVSSFSSKNFKSFDYNLVNFFNMIYFADRPYLLEKILIELNKNLDKNIHYPKCEQNCFFCNIYTPQIFEEEKEAFLNKQKRKDVATLQDDFPTLYKYLYNEISTLYDSIQNGRRSKIVPKLFIVISFHMLFERNYVKCLYLIEKTNSIDKGRKKGFYVYQIEYLINKILSFHKGKSHKKLSALTSNNDNIGKILSAEKLIKKSLNLIKDMMITFTNEIVEFSTFYHIISKFLKEYHFLTYKINNLFFSTKCNIPYSKDKFSIYFNYVYGEVPLCLTESFDKFFSLQNSSLIEIFMKDTYLLLFKVNFLKTDINLKVKYASEELISKLRYTTNEFRFLDIKTLFAKTFYKSYKYTITFFLRNGKDIITIENFCLLDKDRYVVLFDIEGTSLYTTSGMVLFFKLKPAKEQKLIKDKKKVKKKDKNNFDNLSGSCFIFTNNNGRIVSLSRGFEDFFHLKYEVLRENHLNVKDIFKIEKLEEKGSYKTTLIKTYDNIIEIFNEKIGLIGEDNFSKSIVEIKEVKDGLLFSGIIFNVSISYEKRSMRRENHKKKVYYLFTIDVALKDAPKNVTNTLKETTLSLTNFYTRIEESNNLNEIIDAPREVVEKILHTTLNQKILYSNRISYYILKRYFNTKIPPPGRYNKGGDIEELLEEEEKQKKSKRISQNNNNQNNLTEKKQNDFFINDGILNLKDSNRTDNNFDLRKYMIIHEDKYLLRYIVLILSIFFPILFLIIIFYKLNSLSDQENYFRGHINFEMVGLTLMDVLSKVFYMQFQGNKLQPDLLENEFNNSFHYHSEQLVNRIYDYNSFYIKFYQFYTGRIVGTNPYFFELYQKAVLYKIPDQSGIKTETTAQMSSIHLTELLSCITSKDPIPIYYNNSEYYFTHDMVAKSNLTDLDYYYCANGYVGFLVNFLASYKYYNNEITNYYGTYALNTKISGQKGISISIILFIAIFIFYCLIAFFIFYLQTQKLFARYFISYTQLRFFHIYLQKKTTLIYEMIDNHEKNSKVRELLSRLKFENEYEQIATVRHIISGKIEHYKQIKIKPLSINYQPPKIDLEEVENELMEIEKKKNPRNSLLVSMLKRNTIKNIQTAQSRVSFAIQNYSSKRLSQINQPKKKSESTISLYSNINNSFIGKNLVNNINNNNNNNVNNNNNNINNINNNNYNNYNSNYPISNRINTNNSANNNITARTNATSSTVTSSINLMNSTNKISADKHQGSGLTGNKLLSKPLLYCGLFLTLIFLGLILIVLGALYYYYSFGLVDSFTSIMTTFRSLFAEIKFLHEMELDFLMSILRNEEFITYYNSTPYSYICGELENQYKENIYIHEMFLELSGCFPSFKPIVDTLVLGTSDKRMVNLINFQKQIQGKNFCENYAKYLSSNKNHKILNDIKLIKNVTYESLYSECRNIGDGLNNEGFQTVVISLYTTLNTLYNNFKDNNNRTEKYNLELLNDKDFIMLQLETYYLFSKMSICYYLIMNEDMESAHVIALRIESILLILQFIIMITAIGVYFYNVIKYRTEVTSIDFFNKCILHMILFK